MYVVKAFRILGTTNEFTKVKDDPEVAFCHNGGFIVKTKSKNLGKAWNLIEVAYSRGEVA